MTRTLYFVVSGLCLGFAMIIAAELNLTISAVAAAPGDVAPAETERVAEPQASPEIDQLTAEILARPLFSPDRHPPASPDAPDTDTDAAPAKAAPELRGRLAGMLIGPDDEREAIFARDGEKPLAVKVGDDVDGWTISAIEAERVVLTSEFGERVVTPTPGAPGEGAAPNRPAVMKQAASIPPRPGIAPPQPQINNPLPARVGLPPGAGRRPAALPTARQRDTN